jgi:hypothetical protein
MPILSPIDGGAIQAVGAALLNTLFTTADAKRVYDSAALVDLWVPDFVEGSGAAFSLVGAKNYRRMTPLSGSDAPAIQANAFGARPALLTGDTSGTIGDVSDGAANMFPAGRSYSVVCGVQPNLGSTSQYPWGTDGASATYCWIVQAGNVRIYHNNALMGASSQVVSGSAPHVHVWSYNHATRVGVLRVNKAVGFTKTGITDPEVPTNTSLNLFAFGAGGTAASPLMRMGCFMLFDGVALADAGQSALLGSAENLAYSLVNL